MAIINSRNLRAFGIAVPILSLLFFWIFDSTVNLWETGVTPGFLLGIANALLTFWIYKNRI